MTNKITINSGIDDIANKLDNALLKKKVNLKNDDDILELSEEIEIIKDSDFEKKFSEGDMDQSISVESLVKMILEPNIKKWLDLNLEKITKEIIEEEMRKKIKNEIK